MRIARLAAVVLTLGAVLFASAPASAGGPTSVLVVSPATGRTASLYATNEAYTTLMSQVGLEPRAETGRAGAPPGIGGDQIVVTWLVHDVQPWRVDRITLDGEGLPEWVHTTQSMGAGPIAFDDEGVWHRPGDPEALADLLAELGLMGRTGARPVAEEPDEAAGQVAAAATPPADGGALDAATWVLPAVAGGVVAGVLGDRWLRRRREGRDGGRWQLVDAPGPSA
ncbi:hypothetical protein [Jiangella endophytica]|uniref:hypothetical protein n=1 Tax=Jiangella endophytica TaxID=1623398 RepID=UPI000E344B32|nr:hypothetical protein [Jiangella endophytica]